MSDEQQKFTDLALKIYRNLDRNRAYALTSEATDALGALAAAYRKAGGAFDLDGQEKFGEFLKKFGAEVPGMFQPTPTDPPPLPKLWRDPLTNEPLPNPFKKETRDFKAQMILGKRDPELAAFLRKMATDPWGTLVAIQDAAAKAARAKTIQYDHEIHRVNPFVSGSLTEQGEMAKRDPALAAYYQREAKPLTLPWQVGQKHLTNLGRLSRANPEWAALAQSAGEIQRAWAVQAREAAKKEFEHRRQEIARLEHQLQGRA